MRGMKKLSLLLAEEGRLFETSSGSIGVLVPSKSVLLLIND